MRLSRLAPFLVVLISLPAPIAAQDVAVERLTLDRIFASRDFFGDNFGPARWLNGSVYTTLEGSDTTPGGRDIVEYDARTGDRKVLVPASALIPAGQARPLGISNYIWSEDHGRLLVFTNTRRVWRTNTRGDYWVLDVASGELRQLGGGAPEASLMFAKFSPDGTRVGYVRENNIYVEDLTTGAITQLTHDGSTTIINGTFDWVYEEELSLQDGFRWSPDGARIAYWQLDAEGVRDFLLINNTDSLYSYVIPIQYPKAGTTNSAARIGVVPASGGATTWFATEGDPRNNYLARMEWAESPNEVIIQQLNRLQNTNRVMLGDARTGAVRTIMTDADSAWVDVVDDLYWLDGGKAFTWVSERDGWRRVYRVSRDGRSIMPITPANVDIVSVVQVDDEGGWLYYMASPTNATQRYLFRARLDRKRQGRATLADGSAGNAQLPAVARRHVGVSPILECRDANGDFPDHAAEASRGAHTGDQRLAQGHDSGDQGSPHRILPSRHRQRREARRMADGAQRFRSIQEVPGALLRVRRAGRPDGAGSLGRAARCCGTNT